MPSVATKDSIPIVDHGSKVLYDVMAGHSILVASGIAQLPVWIGLTSASNYIGWQSEILDNV